MGRPHKSIYQVRNLHKYHGNADRIICRSGPERAICRYFDINSNVVKWSSEEIVVPYICATDGRPHRYFVDFFAQLADGTCLLIEYKPASQTVEPQKPRKLTKKSVQSYQNAMMTYLKNRSKWKAAREYAASRGWKFQVWTENHLHAIGIRFV